MKQAHYFSDCGQNSDTGRGVDTKSRIEGCYSRAGIYPYLYREERPLGVSFAAATTLAATKKVMGNIWGNEPETYAVNCASRAGFKGQPLLYMKTESGDSFIGYGHEVFSWLQKFSGRIELILEVQGWARLGVENFRRGTQFRSLEYLVPVHAHLLQGGSVQDFSFQERDIIQDQIPEKSMVVAPLDEFGNARLILRKGDFEELRGRERFPLKNIGEVVVGNHINDASSTELTLWPSSNGLPNEELLVANLGYRWNEETEGGNSPQNQALSEKLSRHPVLTIEEGS